MNLLHFLSSIPLPGDSLTGQAESEIYFAVSRFHLVIGANGTIGRFLTQELERRHIPYFKTLRRPHSESNALPLDLAEPSTWANLEPWLEQIASATFCAGITREVACEQEPELSYRINVESSFHILQKLCEKKIFVTYLSSNLVFNGSQPLYDSTASLSPTTRYGRHKAELESRISVLPSSQREYLAVLRLTKVIAPPFELFSHWRRDLAQGVAIQPFADKTFSPLNIDRVCEALVRLSEQKKAGIYHLGATDEITYLEAARVMALELGFDPSLIHPQRDPSPLAAAHSSLRPSADFSPLLENSVTALRRYLEAVSTITPGFSIR